MCGRSHRGCYQINYSYFPRQKFVSVYVLLYFSFLGPHSSGQTNFMRGWVGFFWWFGQFLWSQSAASSNRAILFYLWFSSELVFLNNSIVHCIPAYSLSLLLNYHQYSICFVVISHIPVRSMYSPILVGFRK